MPVGRRVWITAGALVTVLLLGGGTAGACKAALDCRGMLGFSDADPDPPPVVVAGGGVFVDGFVEQTVVGQLVEPTDFAFLRDGRILVAEKRGLIRLVADGTLAARPVLDLRDSVSTQDFRGVITVQVDPSFPRRPYIYVLRTLATEGEGPAHTTARLSRFTLRGDVARRQSEVVLLGRVGGARSCGELPASADCLPADFQHIGAQIRFSGGTLFVSTGDGGGGATGGYDAISGRAQDVDSLGGKILRITRTGAGVPSNPFWNGDPSANRSKVWARGLRNPFRFVFRPRPHGLYVADLGNRQFDEISLVRRGDNLGWPCYEGTARFPPYERAPLCVSLYAQGASAVQPPAVEFTQDEARTLIGGVFSTGTAFPRRFTGEYFFADFTYGWMKRLRFGADGRPRADPEPFGTRLSGPVAIQQGPDGLLYYLSYVKGELRRIHYRG